MCNESCVVPKEEPDKEPHLKFSLNLTFVSDFAGWIIHGRLHSANPALKEILDKIYSENRRELRQIDAQNVPQSEKSRLIKEAHKRRKLARKSAIDAFEKETTHAQKDNHSKNTTNLTEDAKVSEGLTKEALTGDLFYKNQEMFAIIISFFVCR